MRAAATAGTAALLLAGCGVLGGAAPEVAACEAFTRAGRDGPAARRLASTLIADQPMTLAAYKARAGYGPRTHELMRLHLLKLDLDIARARREGGAGQLGVRSVALRFAGAGGEPERPSDGAVCEFRLIDGALQDADYLEGTPDRALSNREMQDAARLLGKGKVPSFDPDVPCCLVP